MMKTILLLAFGGPRSLDEVESFLSHLFKGKRLPPEHLEGVKERYRLIGGSSPLPEITSRQALVLEKRLNLKGYSFKSYVGMRYGNPSIGETLKEIIRNGQKEVFAIPMAPFRSRYSTSAYQEELNRSNEVLGNSLEIHFINGWHSHPLFLQAVIERIEEGLEQFSREEKKEVHLIFTAHSLPESVAESDPYVQDMKETVTEVLKKIGPFRWHMAFQSQGLGPERWIGPEVEPVLIELRKVHVKSVLVIPIGFVSDHIEVLYDIDILYREKAKSLGMVLKRTPSLNDSERFIEALATIVEEHLREGKESGV